jgi:hypothetical protein
MRWGIRSESGAYRRDDVFSGGETPHTHPITMNTYAPLLQVATRAPHRITISDALFRRLTRQADMEGRSTSNLCAYLLERGIDPLTA